VTPYCVRDVADACIPCSDHGVPAAEQPSASWLYLTLTRPRPGPWKTC
jgi:hypothetical protein